MVFKIGWLGQAVGKLVCRMVEEPQDFYFRGVFQPVSGDQPYPFTLRPGKDYESEICLLVEVVSGAARAATVPEPSVPEAPADPEASGEGSAAKKSGGSDDKLPAKGRKAATAKPTGESPG